MQPNKSSTSQPHHTSSPYHPSNINSPPYNPNTPPAPPENPPPEMATHTPVIWNERAVRIMIENKELDGFAATIQDPVVAFIWEAYLKMLVTNERILQDIKRISEAQGYAQRIAELLGNSLQWTTGLRRSLAELSEMQARNFDFLQAHGLNDLLHQYKAPPPPKKKEIRPPPGHYIKTHPGGLRSFEKIQSKKTAYPPPTMMTMGPPIIPSTPPLPVLAPLEYVTALTTPMVPTTPMPSASGRPAPVPAPGMTPQEFLALLTTSLTENATNIPNPAALQETPLAHRSALSPPVRGTPYPCGRGNPPGRKRPSGPDIRRQEIENALTKFCDPVPIVPSSPSATSNRSSSGSSSSKKHSRAKVCPTCSADPGHFYRDCPMYQCFHCKSYAPGHYKSKCPNHPRRRTDGIDYEDDNVGYDEDLYGD